MQQTIAILGERYYNKIMAIFISKSREDTEKFAEEFAKTLHAGDVVLLDGEMGAGKTAAHAIDEYLKLR